MAAVVTYWQLPEDELKFLKYLEGTGPVMAVPTSWTKTPVEATPEPIRAFIERHNPTDLFFGTGPLTDELVSQWFGDELLFGTPAMVSSVVGYSRGKLCSDKLTQSNLYFYTNYPNDDATEMVAKSESFIRWARAVINWVRRMTPEMVECNGYPYRATKRVKEAVNDRAFEVALY